MLITDRKVIDQVTLTITTKAMLEAAGFKVEAENLATADANTKILSQGNYQMGCGNSVVFDEAQHGPGHRGQGPADAQDPGDLEPIRSGRVGRRR
jgi:hypothetical protein